MNGRILELVKNPELIGVQDVDLLKKEIDRFPYVQSLRALHLLGTHRYAQDDYAGELSVTAAYTTDKKILYQFINYPAGSADEILTEETPAAVLEQKEAGDDKEETTTEENSSAEIAIAVAPAAETQRNISDNAEPHHIYTSVEPKTKETPAPVVVNGKTNRILFPGEEDFMTTEGPVIDLEATLESGTIVLQEEQEIVAADLATEPTPSGINSENDQISEKLDVQFADENQLITDLEEITDAETAIPEAEHATIDESKELTVDNEPAKPAVTYEEEQFEVIKKNENEQGTAEPEFTESADAETFTRETNIQENKINTEKAEIEDSAKVSFHGLEEFLPDVKIAAPKPEKAEQPVPAKAPNRHEEERQRLIAEVEAKLQASKKTPKKVADEGTESQDVNFAETQSFEFKNEKKESEDAPLTPVEESKKNETEKQAEPRSDWKPMTLSTSTLDAVINTRTTGAKPAFAATANPGKEEDVPVEKTQNTIAETKEQTDQSEPDSNVPAFINTWQSWLKIDRSETADTKIEISITEVKNKVIENFIEKEPKISKLRDESDFVIRERTDDIWHLMTETLATLYIEQKLYAKAIKAFHVLTEKHPHKKKHYDGQIAAIKELRQKNNR